MVTPLELPIKIFMMKICFILVIIAGSILAVPVTETTDLPVDRNVDPCDDFYEFTCAKFKSKHPIPADKSSISQFSIVEDLMEEKLRALLEEPIAEREIRPFQMVKSMYQACMNTKNIEASSLVALKRIIKNTGGWPVTEGDSWNVDEFNWQRTAYKLLKSGFEMGYNIFFQVYVGADPRNSTNFIITIMQPLGTGPVPDELMKIGWEEPTVKAYYEYMKNVAKKLGADQHRLNKEMKEVIDLEIAIAKIGISEENKRDFSMITNLMTIQELNEKYPYVDWLSYIDNVMHSDGKKSHLDDIVNVREPTYLEGLKNVLEGLTQRNVANYIYWQAISSAIDYMDDEIRDLELEVTSHLTGTEQRPPRWQECITTISSPFQVAIGALYVRNFFDVKSKTVIADMVYNIKNELKQNIRESHWMDNTTKARALQKSDAMQEYIAYPNELLNDTKIEEFYQQLNINAENYLESMLNATAITTRLFLNVDQPMSFNSWQFFSPVEINAFYLFDHNTFQILAGILQGVIFSTSRPLGMNYGSIGMVIGHEMSHGFDDQGSQFDKNGNLVDWWKPETKETFAAKARCIVDQYGNLTVPEVKLNLNGINTQGENIADNAGVKLAYLAYKKWAASHETGLPQAPYTPEQLFWISFGMTWCVNDRTEMLKMKVMVDPHSPSRYRVNVPLMNSEFFAKDFSCPIGSSMNPKNKCAVW